MTTQERVAELTARGRAKVSDPAALAVLDALTGAEGHCRTQDDLARVLPDAPAKRDRALRVVREIVRFLRVNCGLPIASCADGYFLPASQAQVDEFIARLEREAKARAKSSLETYRAMRATFALPPQADFLDALEAAISGNANPDALASVQALKLENAALRCRVARWGRPPDEVRKERLAAAAKTTLQSDLFGANVPGNGCNGQADKHGREDLQG